jgi:transketolase
MREGKDVALAACGVCVHLALEAAALLEAEGVSARVVNLSTIKPLDEAEILAAARETGALVTIEEHNVLGGMGSAVCEFLSGRCPVPVERMGMRDEFGMSGRSWDLMKHYGFTPENVAAAARRAMALKR